MAAPTTYSELKDEIDDYLATASGSSYAGRSDLGIDLAESRFNATLRTRRNTITTTLTLDGSGEADLPTDYAGFKRAVANESHKVTLEEVTADWMDDQHSYDHSGWARHIAIEGGKVRVRPISASTISFVYYQAITPLTDDNTSNWVLANFPGLYIGAAAYELAMYFDEEEDAQRFATMMADQMRLVEERNDNETLALKGRLRVKGPTP